jgi:hypothetical protein
MRRRNKRKTSSVLEHSPTTIVVVAEVQEAPVPAALPWRVEQLHALGPVKGPSHRTSVPIVRSTEKDNSLGDRAGASSSRSQLSFISEGLESLKGRDSL